MYPSILIDSYSFFVLVSASSFTSLLWRKINRQVTTEIDIADRARSYTTLSSGEAATTKNDAEATVLSRRSLAVRA